MIRGCTDKNVHATGLPDHLLFDHYRIFKTVIDGIEGLTGPDALPLRCLNATGGRLPGNRKS